MTSDLRSKPVSCSSPDSALMASCLPSKQPNLSLIDYAGLSGFCGGVQMLVLYPNISWDNWGRLSSRSDLVEATRRGTQEFLQSVWCWAKTISRWVGLQESASSHCSKMPKISIPGINGCDAMLRRQSELFLRDDRPVLKGRLQEHSGPMPSPRAFLNDPRDWLGFTREPIQEHHLFPLVLIGCRM